MAMNPPRAAPGGSGGSASHLDHSDGSVAAVSVTLWLRDDGLSAPASQQSRLREQVTALETEGVETTIRTWPAQAMDPGTEPEQTAVEAFDRFRAVAGRQGVRLDPLFECWVTADGSRTVTFPPACLALERGGDLTGLYPCCIDGEAVTVEEGLAALADGNAENLR